MCNRIVNKRHFNDFDKILCGIGPNMTWWTKVLTMLWTKFNNWLSESIILFQRKKEKNNWSRTRLQQHSVRQMVNDCISVDTSSTKINHYVLYQIFENNRFMINSIEISLIKQFHKFVLILSIFPIEINF